jgi:hypothetical protein
MRLPTGAVVALEWNDAQRLVDALWGVSATQGAVVAIGKIGHRISRRNEAILQLSNEETLAIRVALTNRSDLASALVGLLDVPSGD